VDERQEIARLRAELADAMATIEQVRAAARKARDSNNAWDLEDLISAALEGGVRGERNR
jgi:C4-dicarboxylate-specific signal transduction histidine kinase